MRDLTHHEDLQDSVQEALITLFDIDLSKVNGGMTYFCAQVNEKNEAIVWRGIKYLPYPIQAGGFEMSAEGSSSRPTITISNLMGWVTGAINEYDGLVGCHVTRRRVNAKYLDPENFISGQNPNHDPLAEVIDRWTINRLTSLNSRAATFELASPSETDNAVLPARQVLANVSPTLTDLRQKYGKTAVLPYRGFPSVNRKGG